MGIEPTTTWGSISRIPTYRKAKSPLVPNLMYRPDPLTMHKNHQIQFRLYTTCVFYDGVLVYVVCFIMASHRIKTENNIPRPISPHELMLS